MTTINDLVSYEIELVIQDYVLRFEPRDVDSFLNPLSALSIHDTRRYNTKDTKPFSKGLVKLNVPCTEMLILGLDLYIAATTELVFQKTMELSRYKPEEDCNSNILLKSRKSS